MKFVRSTRLFLLLICPILMKAQEVRYIDLSTVTPRTELRHPPAPPREDGVGGGFGGVSVADGAPDRRDPHALGVQLLDVSPAAINPSEPFEVEFKVANTGLANIELPVSAHLSDLQPADESVPFTYFSITLVVSVEGDWRHPAFAMANLYGATDREGTLLVLRPGEWIRVRAKVKSEYSPVTSQSARLVGGFWLRRNTFNPQPGGAFTRMENLYPNVTPTPPVPIQIVAPTARTKP
jgi:hypothetical protein